MPELPDREENVPQACVASASYLTSEASARLATERAEALQTDLRIARLQLGYMRRSLSWRITEPLRWVRGLSRGITPQGTSLKSAWNNFRNFYQSHRKPTDIVNYVAAAWKDHRKTVSGLEAVEHPVFVATETVRQFFNQRAPAAKGRLQPRFLLIADLMIPQCVKYRVTQKVEMLSALGWTVEVADWRDGTHAFSALQVATEVIFYRVPGTDASMLLLQEAQRLGLAPFWEVDDLLFDSKSYQENTNLNSLSIEERSELLRSAGHYLQAMQFCGRAIASTEGLAEQMRSAGIREVAVLENGLDTDTLNHADRLLSSRQPKDPNAIWICYGSGSRAHDRDFREAEDGLLAAMEKDIRLHLHIIGPVTCSDALLRFQHRIRRTSEVSYAEYLAYLAQADIAIAPLEATVFNECKSNIKFLEAAVLRVPSICSPTAAFRRIIQNGHNGLLATTTEDWRKGFLSLAHDEALRGSIGLRAEAAVHDLYAPDKIRDFQVASLFSPPAPFTPRKPRVLQVNVFFAPRSFGGATIVVEALCAPLIKAGYDVSILTTRPVIEPLPEGAMRYEWNDLDVFSVVAGRHAEADNLSIARYLERWIRSWNVDLVHFHAIQDMGASMALQCKALGIPYVISLHDCWWLSNNLFIGRDDGSFHLDDSSPTGKPVESTADIYQRARRVMMREALSGAALILSPSEEHRALYVKNGVNRNQIKINRNGFSWPSRPRASRADREPLRFGFVGGMGPAKGFDLIRKAFERVQRSDWSLTLVDNTLSLGFASIDVSDWKITGRIRTIPAYTQSEIDDFYDEIDVLLFPSQWPESYGLAVREALARDVWVITTTPGGQSEEIVDGINGTLIPIIDDATDLRLAVEAALHRQDLFVSYLNPHKHTLPTYDSQARELITFYDQALNRQG